MLRRVEIHADSVQLLLIRQALVGQARDVQSDLELIGRRLSPSERLCIAPSDDALVQVVLPLRVKARGGRTWMALPDGRSPLVRGAVDPVLVDGLSRAHGIVAEVGVRLGVKQFADRNAKAPASAYHRALATLAFLAPDIQAAIVGGRQPVGLKLEHLLRTHTPLAWADQRAKFGIGNG